MSFIREIFAGEANRLDDEFIDRLDTLAAWSGQTRNLIRRIPECINWLHAKYTNPLSPISLNECWETEFGGDIDDLTFPEFMEAIRRFRSWMSLRCAFREFHELITVEDSLTELSQLADFCLDQVYKTLVLDLTAQHGTPWNDVAGHPSQFCILGMGKLGGYELNFWSDVDLIFLYDGDGICRLSDQEQKLSSKEFFTRLVQEFTRVCQERTIEGTLFNIDLRLRPEGETGPIVKNLQSTVNYYYTAGQTWERLALGRMRVIAGDSTLGGEFQEEIHSFAYPVHPPPSIIQELAATRARFGRNQEDSEDNLNIKTGFGGIREVEFFTQGHQLLHAGSQPFLQTGSTLDALQRLSQYGVVDESLTKKLRKAYLFLRLLENRLQMQEEQPVHKLPTDVAIRSDLALTHGFSSWESFDKQLAKHRELIRHAYLQLFEESATNDDAELWYGLFSGQTPDNNVAEQLREWFGDREDTQEQLRLFLLGSHKNLLTEEHVRLFLSLKEHFPKVLPQLAFPLRTLRRIGKFADYYGTRKGLFRTCAHTPNLFGMLALLFDRSPYIHELLCRHPELLDELLTQPVRLLKDSSATIQELDQLPEGDESPKWLWLYIRAEQIRASMGEHLGYFDTPVIEQNLSRLADSVIRQQLRQSDLQDQIGIVALGKYGAEELTIGSDLDILIVSHEKSDIKIQKASKSLIKALSWQGSNGPTFDIDTRLRPYGQDSPLVHSLEALRNYYFGPAQLWERQCLTRARFVAGPIELAEQFNKMREDVLFGQNFGARDVQSIFSMIKRIRKEKAKSGPKWLSFKTCPGGLLEIEFFVQILQIHYGRKISEIRSLTHTRDLFRLLPKHKCIEKQSCARLLLNYNYLRKLEFFLRRFHGRSTNFLASNPEELTLATRWFQESSTEAFLHDYQRRIEQSSSEIKLTLENTFGLDIV